MDESHRLKPMVENYDQKLFLTLFKETKALRKKLAFDIVNSKFGVDEDEVLSWFDVKFLYAFNKYYGNDKLKGYIINSLRTFKKRIIISSYQNKYAIHNTVDIDEVFSLGGDPVDEIEDDITEKVDLVKKYLKDRLSDDAYFLLEIELNPPPFIVNRLADPEKTKMPKIPAELIAEYLGIDDNLDQAVQLITELRSETKQIIKQAREYFSLLEKNKGSRSTLVKG
jgi:hypothetical protein